MASATTRAEEALKDRPRKKKKLRVIEPTAPKRLRAQAHKRNVVALRKGFYNHRRIAPGTTFTMYLVGDIEKDVLPEWVAFPGTEEANQAINVAMEDARFRSMPGASKVKYPEVAESTLAKLRGFDESDSMTDANDEDDEDDLDDDDEESGSSGGGGSGSSVI